MKTPQLSASLITVLFTLFTLGSDAQNLSVDVEKLIQQQLLNDDYADTMQASPPVSLTLESREVTTPVGMNAKRVGDLVYFFNNDRILAFDLQNGSWSGQYDLISPLTSAFTVDEANFFVVHNNNIYKYDFLASPPVLLTSPTQQVDDIHVLNDFLVVALRRDVYDVIDKNNGQLVDTQEPFFGFKSSTVVPSKNKVFSFTSGVSPSDIRFMEVDQNGIMSGFEESPYHGDFPNGDRVYAFPDGNRVIDGSGTVYHSNDLTYAGSFAGSFDHVDFFQDIPILLRRDQLYSYSNSLVETGVYSMPQSKDVFFIKDDLIYLFDYNALNIDVETIQVSELGPISPGQPVNPVGLVYAPDSIVDNLLNEVYLLSRNNLTIFVYDVSAGAYKDGFALLEAPLFMSYSAAHQLIYLAYSDGRITAIDPVTGEESGLVNSPQTPCGLAAAGNYVFVCDPSGALVSHYTYNRDGVLISRKEWNYYSDEFVWNENLRKMFFFKGGSSQQSIIWEDIGINGVIGDSMFSPYEGDRSFKAPICIHTDGSRVLLGDGLIYDSLSLAETNTLNAGIQYCAWSKSTLYTISEAAGTELQSWDDNYVANTVESRSGEPLNLISLSSGALVVIYELNGMPVFELFNDKIFAGDFE